MACQKDAGVAAPDCETLKDVTNVESNIRYSLLNFSDAFTARAVKCQGYGAWIGPRNPINLA